VSYRFVALGIVLAALTLACAPASGSTGSSTAPAPSKPAPAAASQPSAGGQPAAAPPAASAPATSATAPAAPAASRLVRVAEEQGYFRAEGVDLEWRTLSPELSVTAVLAGEADYSTTPSSTAAAASKGAPIRIVQFMAAKLQHQLVGRADLGGVPDLAGKRVAVNRQGDLTAFEVRVVLDHFRVPDVTLISLGRETDRTLGVLSGAVDATVLPVPADIVAERQGLKLLYPMSALLEVPLAGLGASVDHIQRDPEVVAAMVRGAIRGVRYINDPANAADVTALIARWVEIPADEAAIALDRVRDTYSPNGLPTPAGMDNFLTMLRATDAIADDTTADQVADFQITRRVAVELGVGP
jgi:TRAP-type uncharacterized transport system substrate-binding protein